MSETAALTTDWIDVANVQSGMVAQYTSGYTCWPYDRRFPWIQPIVQTVTTTARPIRLTLEEVDTLRAAAKADPALRAILRKFTPQIEVEMTL